MSHLQRWLVPSALLLLAGCKARPTIEADYVFENVNVVPMNEETILAKQAVALRDGKIVAIVDQSRSTDILARERIDGAGRYLMPGLADMHAHVRWTPQAIFNLFLANGVTTVVNMRLDDGEGTIDHRNIELLSTLLLEMHEAGVPLLLSTDSFGAAVPGYSVHQELELLVAAGLTPYEALRTGTVNVAAYLGQTQFAGTVEVGKRSDFVLLENNPLIDIKHAASVKGVFTHGRWYSEARIQDLLIEAKQIVSGLISQDSAKMPEGIPRLSLDPIA